MKSLFNRFRHSTNTTSNPSSRPPSTTSNKDAPYSPNPIPPPISRESSTSASSSSASARPHSILDTSDVPVVEIWADEEGRRRTFDQALADPTYSKKVTFKSPSTSLVLDEMVANQVTKVVKSQSHSSPNVGSSSKTSKPLPQISTKPTPPSRQSYRKSSSNATFSPSEQQPHNQTPSQPHSISPTKSSYLSPTPSDGSDRSYLTPPNSWSEMAEEELIANLGPRERTRQEVLWEIVSSEERYVQELIKLNKTFSSSLLPASAMSPTLPLPQTFSPPYSPSPPASPALDFLPIASKYASGRLPHSSSLPGSRSPSDGTGSTIPEYPARMQAYNILTHGRPGTQSSSQARSHHSLPPPPRTTSATPRMSYQPSKTPLTRTELPDDLEQVLKVLSNGILEGHIKLAAALRARYDNQYPLVRSLADVFISHSYILREYNTYVLHLERALAQADEALLSVGGKRNSKRIDTAQGRLGKLLLSLEELAAERGESGLVISLSKPFQRLLKYPLLFQNLLFNTDPSTKEYEATLAIVDEVEVIVRSIEDEKTTSEERERTRDVWARIECLERDKILMTPKPNRLLVSETALIHSTDAFNTIKQKKSFRRLSDILKEQKHVEQWVVRFSDVSLLCEKIGTTHLPISTVNGAAATAGESRKQTRRSQSIRARNLYKFVKVHEWHLKQKTGSQEGLLSMEEISRARTNPPPPPSKITTPTKTRPRDIAQNGSPTPTKVPLKDHDSEKTPTRHRKTPSDAETISDAYSVMSFAFKGSDQVKPRPKPLSTTPSQTIRQTHLPSSTTPVFQRRISGNGEGHAQYSAATAKFAHRLRAPEEVTGSGQTLRPSSRARSSLPPAMRPIPSALSPTDRNTKINGRTTPSSGGTAKPPWNGGGGSGAKAASVAGSIRAPKSSMTSLAGSVSLGKAGATRKGVDTPSKEGVEVWKRYQGIGGGSDGTPGKRLPPGLAGRQLGGKI